jgi:hypothetical protein
MALPRQPGQDDETPMQNAPSIGTKLIVAGIAALLVLVLVLHLTGVIAGH